MPIHGTSSTKELLRAARLRQDVHGGERRRAHVLSDELKPPRAAAGLRGERCFPESPWRARLTPLERIINRCKEVQRLVTDGIPVLPHPSSHFRTGGSQRAAPKRRTKPEIQTPTPFCWENLYQLKHHTSGRRTLQPIFAPVRTQRRVHPWLSLELFDTFKHKLDK